jgi:hypothetical protein
VLWRQKFAVNVKRKSLFLSLERIRPRKTDCRQNAKSVNLPIINFITRRTRRLIWQKLEKVQKNVKITLEK